MFTLLDAHDVPYTKPYVAKMSPVWSVLLSMAPFLLIILLTLFMSAASAGKGGMGGLMNVGKSNAKVYMEKSTGVTFADVAGQDDSQGKPGGDHRLPPQPRKIYRHRRKAAQGRAAGGLPRHRQDIARQGLWPAKPRSPSSPSPAPILWKCSWA